MVGGGFILYFFDAMMFTMLLKPDYEPPVNTVADLNERNMTLVIWAGLSYYVDKMKKAYNQHDRILGKMLEKIN